MRFQRAIGGQPFAVVGQAAARAGFPLREVRRDAEGTDLRRGGWLGSRALPIGHAPEPGTVNVKPRLRLLTAIGRSLRLLEGTCEASLVGMQAADVPMQPYTRPDSSPWFGYGIQAKNNLNSSERQQNSWRGLWIVAHASM